MKHSILHILILLFPFSVLAENRALLIGIDDYQYVTNLVGSAKDVENMQYFAEHSLGFKSSQIKTLTNKQATKAGIVREFKRWLIDATQADDQVLFYYSGHGYQITDHDGDETDQQDETLVNYDGKINGDNMLSDDELKGLFQRLENRQVLAIIDSCHSGSITRGLGTKADARFIKSPQPSKSLTRSIKKVTQSSVFQHGRQEQSLLTGTPKQVIWSAVSAAQKAFVDSYSPNYQGVFTRRFIAGIAELRADTNLDNKISNNELLNYLRHESTVYCKQDKDCSELGLGLTPTLEPKQVGGLLAGFSPVVPSMDATANLLPENQPEAVTISIQTEGKITTQIAFQSRLLIKISSQRAGYLLLLDINSKQELSQLFPNRFHPDNKISANQPLYIPDIVQRDSFEFKATERGNNQIIAIVTHDPIDLLDLTPISRDLSTVAKPETHLNTLASSLQQVWTADKTNRAPNYSLTRKHYVVY